MSDARREQLHRPFRPRRARRWASVLAVAQAAVFVATAVLVPAEAGIRLSDRIGFVVAAALIAAPLVAVTRVVARPDETGLHVQNLVRRHRWEWSAIVAVRFGPADPWVHLDLDDGSSVPVLAVQRSDGQAAEREAGRLAALVVAHAGRA